MVNEQIITGSISLGTTRRQHRTGLRDVPPEGENLDHLPTGLRLRLSLVKGWSPNCLALVAKCAPNNRESPLGRVPGTFSEKMQECEE